MSRIPHLLAALSLAFVLNVGASVTPLHAQEREGARVSAPAQAGSVRGQVLGSESARPLPLVDIAVLRLDLDPGLVPGDAVDVAQGSVVARGETSQAGRFLIGNLPAGRYVVEARTLGLTGSAFANAGTRGDGRTGGRLGYQSGPFTLQGGTFLRRSDRVTESFELRQNLQADPETFRRQDRDSWSGSLGVGADLSLEYRPRESLLLRGEGRLQSTAADSRGSTLTSHFDYLMDPTGRYDRFTDSDQDRGSINGELGFEWNLGTRGHDLSGSASADRGENLGLTLLQIRDEAFFQGETGALHPDDLDDLDLALLLPPDFQLRDERDTSQRERMRLDYTRPWTPRWEGWRFREVSGQRGRPPILRCRARPSSRPATPVSTLP